MMIGMILAASTNGVIGKYNQIPWHYKGELKWFKDTTEGHAIIMGRRTWKSLPKKPLKNRLNIVVTSSEELFPGAVVAKSFDNALDLAEVGGYDETWLIGGSGIFKQGSSYADVIYLTQIPEHIEENGATVRFDMGRGWELQSTKQHPYVEELIIEAYGRP